jgi:3-isopropylmalate/(R)-2-methylmalate dehydratase small subunit
MKAFTRIFGMAAPLLRDNVDTDTIIPSREMTSTGKTGLRDGLFAPWRYLDGPKDRGKRVADPAFVLNQRPYADAPILLAGRNFGCGSSREHAVWALVEYGITCVIAASFAPIFRANCLRNGLLPVVLTPDVIAGLAGREIAVDLATQTAGGWHFEIEDEGKNMLLHGLDAIDVTLQHADAIAAWWAADRLLRPYVYLEKPR